MVKKNILLIKPILLTAAVKSRTITIKGPWGTLTKTFKHIKVEITLKEENGAKFLELNCYLNTYKQSAIIFTISSHIKNITGPFIIFLDTNSRKIVE